MKLKYANFLIKILRIIALFYMKFCNFKMTKALLATQTGFNYI